MSRKRKSGPKCFQQRLENSCQIQVKTFSVPLEGFLRFAEEENDPPNPAKRPKIMAIGSDQGWIESLRIH